MSRWRRPLVIVLLLLALPACTARSPRKVFEQYRQAILYTDWNAAWHLLSEDLRHRYGNSPELFAAEMQGQFAKPYLQRQFTTTRILRVEKLEGGRVAVVHASHDTPANRTAERTWRLVSTEDGWRIDEL
jgi:hypothetical protein